MFQALLQDKELLITDGSAPCAVAALSGWSRREQRRGFYLVVEVRVFHCLKCGAQKKSVVLYPLYLRVPQHRDTPDNNASMAWEFTAANNKMVGCLCFVPFISLTIRRWTRF